LAWTERRTSLLACADKLAAAEKAATASTLQKIVMMTPLARLAPIGLISDEHVI
jgi:hypothetical protein